MVLSNIYSQVFLEGTPLVEIRKAYYSVDYGKEITIECRDSAIPKVDEIVWEKTANRIKSAIDKRSSGIIGSVIDNPSLTILNATLTDSGDYVCFAKNKVGIGKSQQTRLTVHGGLIIKIFILKAFSVLIISEQLLKCLCTNSPLPII